jgi:hypothetical protein
LVGPSVSSLSFFDFFFLVTSVCCSENLLGKEKGRLNLAEFYGLRPKQLYILKPDSPIFF